MTTSFMSSPSTRFTSESVTEGHPDKLCDQVSDAILDALLTQDPMSRVACETATTTGTVWVFGEVTTSGYVEIEDIVRETVANIGYTGSDIGFDAATCGVMSSIKGQSPDIARGVDRAIEAREGLGEVDLYDLTGAGDQGMMIGFACTETEELMPLTIALSHRLTRRLAEVRKAGTLDFLRPDGKSQVTVEYAYGAPRRIDAVVISTQHSPDISEAALREAVIEEVIRPICPVDLMDEQTRIYVNPTGRFVVGGPMGDAGLTGRKIIVDTYGGVARHGGGAFSGKDPSKVDRSAAYAARHLAKNVVAAGLAERFEVQVSYAIGVSRPTSIAFETFGTARIDEQELGRLIEKLFDMRPAAIIDRFDLRRPIYLPTASYGHFGRTDVDLPWERLDYVDALRSEAGL
ncbi:MAG: methionine adenosyltransferase [Chloroflexi bacterium]|nr:methionine adenosyltransferase [Chloroflexota bacterium]MDA1239377.1 methionine adenosyltransferase [Chloroflexota bacterium]MQC25679.1 methionine adenosyltransferase [Chloroflexota bacterium]MQC47539.1 methionine adenosyltransferase [Chloroflexota bacterium]